MTQKFNTGKTFATGEQVTAQDLENIVELATPLTALTDDQTLSVNNGQIVVKDGSSTDGVSFQKMKHITARSVMCNTGSSDASPSALSIPNNQVLKGSATGLEAGTIDNDNLTNDGITINASNSATDREINLGDTLAVNGGEGIDVTVASDADTLTISGENASTTNKGIASFSSSDFSVSSGAVSISSVSNSQLAGSIANSKLANDSVTVTAGTALSGGGEVDLGSSVTLNVSGVSNAQIASNAAIATSKLASNSLSVTTDTGLSGGGSIALGGSRQISLSSALPSTQTATTQAAGNNSTSVATTEYVDRIKPNIVAVNSTTTGSDSTNQAWFDFPDLEVTITPRLTGSNFIINANAVIGNERAEMVWGRIVYKVNDGSYAAVAVAPNLGTNRRSIHGSCDMDYDNGNWISSLGLNIFGTGLSYSAGDTLTFKVQLQNSDTSGNATFFNITQNDTDNVYIARGVSTIIVQEV